MKRLILYLFIILTISVPDISPVADAVNITILNNDNGTKQNLSPMEALDLIKEHYAANFEKVMEGSEDEYYYKLAIADYYLVYEGKVGIEENYLIHLYEFIGDDQETGLGHTYTYGWYTVDKKNGKITEKIY